VDPQLFAVRKSESLDAEAAVASIHSLGGNARATWQHFPRLLEDDGKLAGWDLLVAGDDTGLRVEIPDAWNAARVVVESRDFQGTGLGTDAMGVSAGRRSRGDDRSRRCKTTRNARKS